MLLWAVAGALEAFDLCGFMAVLCQDFCLCSVQFILLVSSAVFMVVDCSLKQVTRSARRSVGLASPMVYPVIVT